MKTLQKLFVILTLALPMMMASLGANAQTTGTKFITVDFSRVQEESLVGMNVISQLTQYGNAVKARKEFLENDLQAKSDTLKGQQSILPQDAFDEKVTAFNQETRRAQIELEGYRQNMVREEKNAELEITNNLKPIVHQIMVEKGADLVFDKSLVYDSKSGFDVTDLVIERLNAKITEYKLKLQAPSLSGD